jgi:hypothetical protein
LRSSENFRFLWCSDLTERQAPPRRRKTKIAPDN